MCDNCISHKYWDMETRDFTMEDLRPTIIKHGLDAYPISSFAVTAFWGYMRDFGHKASGVEHATKKLLTFEGYSDETVQRCAQLYKNGLVVLEELKKKGTKHQPRK